jgi:ABC-type molybdate transport system ATPase subunit
MFRGRLALVHRHWIEEYAELEVSAKNRKRLEGILEYYNNLTTVTNILTSYGLFYWTSHELDEENRMYEASIWIEEGKIPALLKRLKADVSFSKLVSENQKNNLFNAFDLTKL